MDGRRMIFLAGLHRSGTTPLARLLAAHPEISGFSETGVPANEGQHLQTVYPPAREHGGPGRFGFASESHLTEDSPLATEENAQRLFEEWSEHWDTSRPLLLEKSPPNLLKTRFLQKLFPGCAFVVIVRHPIPVSIPTSRWRGTRRYHRLLEHWLHCHEIFEADQTRLERVHLVRYEDLVRETEDVLRGIFEFLGVEPIPPSEPIDRSADERYFASWRKLRRDPVLWLYVALSELRFERRARRFGYSLVRPGLSKPARPAAGGSALRRGSSSAA